jgi:hypothetical protein
MNFSLITLAPETAYGVKKGTNTYLLNERMNHRGSPIHFTMILLKIIPVSLKSSCVFPQEDVVHQVHELFWVRGMEGRR